MTPIDFSTNFLTYLQSLTPQTHVEEWQYLGLTNKSYPAPTIDWTGQFGFDFSFDSHAFIIRSIPEHEGKTWLVIESHTRKGQLYNMYLQKPTVYVTSQNKTQLTESYSMTIGRQGKQHKETVRAAFASLGVTTNLISEVDDANPDWQKVLVDLLQWAIYREKVKQMLEKKAPLPNLPTDPKPEPLPKTKPAPAMATIQPINQILYGPPGTGKTYRLQKEYLPRYVENQIKITQKDYVYQLFTEKEFPWWKVVALSLLVQNDQTAVQLSSHLFVQIKSALSRSKTIQAGIRGQLQAHAKIKLEDENVRYKRRSEPLLFEKVGENSKAIWKIDNDLADELEPELVALSKEINEYKEQITFRCNATFTTFHQNFAYEDFIEGIKPVMEETEEGGQVAYAIQKGVFYQCCEAAVRLAGYTTLKECIQDEPTSRQQKLTQAPPYALFIDEINRANVSAVFGELITLIETDKRLGTEHEMHIKLPYSKEEFGVPANLHIIGTMNTADRSIEALDTALRRRFQFVEMMPDVEVLPENLPVKLRETSEIIKLQNLLTTINQRLEVLVSRDHQIGHAYFTKLQNSDDPIATLRSIFQHNILPLLQEYFYHDYAKIGMVLGEKFVTVAQTVQFGQGFQTETEDWTEKKIYRLKNCLRKDCKDEECKKTHFTDEQFIDALRAIYNRTSNL